MSYGFALGLVCKATFEEGDKRRYYYKRTAQTRVPITGHDAGDNVRWQRWPISCFLRAAGSLLRAAASQPALWVSSRRQTYAHDRHAVRRGGVPEDTNFSSHLHFQHTY